MTEKTGHTAAAVAKSGYFAELDKAIDRKEDPKSDTGAVSRFLTGESNVTTLVDELNRAQARGDNVTFDTKALAFALDQVPGLSKENASTILKNAKKVKTRTEATRSRVERASQIKTALMQSRTDKVPRLTTPETNYVQRIAEIAKRFQSGSAMNTGEISGITAVTDRGEQMLAKSSARRRAIESNV